MGIVHITLLLLIGLPLLEIAVFVEVGARIGAPATVALVISMALIGIMAMRRQGLATLQRARASLEKGISAVADVFDGLCVMLAGGLLLFPGFVTDAIGLLLFIPGIRRALGQAIERYLLASGAIRVHRPAAPSSSEPLNPGTVIDGQYEDLTDLDRGNVVVLPPKLGRRP